MRGQVKIADINGLVPTNHLLRKIDRVVDFAVSATWQSFYTAKTMDALPATLGCW